MKRYRYLITAALGFALAAGFAACDLFDGDTKVVEGVVVDAVTGRPLSDIGVQLGTLFFPTFNQRATGVTDSAGQFRLEAERDGLSSWYVIVNDRTVDVHTRDSLLYNPSYSAGDVLVGSDPRHLRVELQPISQP